MRAQNTFLKHGTNSLVWLKSALNEPDYQKRIPIILSLLSQIDEKAYVSSFCQVAEQNIEYIPLSVNFTDPRIIRGLPEEDIARILTSLKKAIQITDDVELENELKESLNIINEASGDKNNEK
jgi:lipopolysaccharide biosynthesis regulator YciM